MWKWLVVALVYAQAAAPVNRTSRGLPSHQHSPNTESPTGKTAVSNQTLSRWVRSTLKESGIDVSVFGAHSSRHAATPAACRLGLSLDTIKRAAGWRDLAETLRRQLMQDNEDYLPSESEGIPMRARLSGDENYQDYDEQSSARPSHRASNPRFALNETRPDDTPPGHQELSAVQKKLEPRLDQIEMRPENDEPYHELVPARAAPRVHDDHLRDEANTELTHSIPTKNIISVENEDYEFKENKQFSEDAPVEEQERGEFEKTVNTLSTLKVEDDALPNSYELEMAKHFEEQAAGDLESPGDGFVARAHDGDDGAPSQALAPLTTKRVITAHSAKPSETDINISKKDLLYYMDEEKFAKSNLSIGFNADVAIDYKDFAQRFSPKTQQEAARDESAATKKFRVLKMPGGAVDAGWRRDGRPLRRFIQEEGATGIAILNMDAGPFPEFRLPRERRQYMHSDRSDAEPDGALAHQPPAHQPPPVEQA